MRGTGDRQEPASAPTTVRNLIRAARVGPKKIFVISAFGLSMAFILLMTGDVVLALPSGFVTAILVALAIVLVAPSRRISTFFPRIYRKSDSRRFGLVLPATRRQVVAGMASIPERAASLRQAVASVVDQVDHLYVYLNNYREVPDFLNSPKITVYRSQDHGDIADSGKFFGLKNHPRGIYFTLDDDIIYPNDYVPKLLEALRQINFAGIVGVHGVYYPRAPKSFLDRRIVHYARSNGELRPVSLLGTGTLAFPIQLLELSLDVFETPRMADVWLAKHAKERRIPMFAVARPQGWLVEADVEIPSNSIWLATKANHSRASAVIVGHRPWGLEDLMARVSQPSLPRRFSRKWTTFVDFYEQHRATDADGTLVRRGEYKRIADYISFYCEPSDVLSIAKAAFGMGDSTSPLFRRCISSVMTYDPAEAGQLYEQAFRHAVSRRKNADAILMASNASKAYRLVGDFSRASDVLLEATQDVDRSSPDLISELINLCLDRHKYSEARELFLTYSHLLPKNTDYNFRLALVIAHCESPAAAAPWITELFLDLRSKRLQGKLISHFRNFYLQNAKIADTPSYSFLEHGCTRGGLDALPTIHLNLAIGDRKAAEKLLVATRSTISRRRPEYLPILDAGVAASFEETIDHLNVAMEYAGFTKLQLEPPDGSSLPLARIRGRAPRVERSELVSVIMTTYNSAATLRYAVESILNQSIRNIELILVDDCSSDDTPDLIASYAEGNSRIIALKSSTNSGPYVCRNIGLQHAKGDYIAIQDSDDYAHSQRLEFQLQMMKQSNWMACYVGHIRIADDGGIVPDNHGELVGEGPMTLMMHRNVMEELGYFKPVRSRGDVEHRDRMAAYYGAHRIGRDDSVLLLARDALSTNSRRFDGDPSRLGIVPRIKAEAHRRHCDAAGDRKRLYVGTTEAGLAPPVRPENEHAVSDPLAERIDTPGVHDPATKTLATETAAPTAARKPARSASRVSTTNGRDGVPDGKKNDRAATPNGKNDGQDGGSNSKAKEVIVKPQALKVSTESPVAAPDRLGPIVRLPRTIKGLYRRPLKRAYLESGELLDKLKTIRHPNLMSVYDYDDEFVYVEYIEGLVLSNRSPFCPPHHTESYIDYADAVDLGSIKEAILCLHANGVAHSDVTSHNIMVTQDGTLKLIDLTCCLPPRKDFTNRDLAMFEDLQDEIQAALREKAVGDSVKRA